MNDLILTIGHDVEGKRPHSRAYVLGMAARILQVEGCTAIPCAGIWRGQAEESTRIEICALSDADAARAWDALPDLAEALEQCEVMAELRPSAVAFIERRGAVKTA